MEWDELQQHQGGCTSTNRFCCRLGMGNVFPASFTAVCWWYTGLISICISLQHGTMRSTHTDPQHDELRHQALPGCISPSVVPTLPAGAACPQRKVGQSPAPCPGTREDNTTSELGLAALCVDTAFYCSPQTWTPPASCCKGSRSHLSFPQITAKEHALLPLYLADRLAATELKERNGVKNWNAEAHYLQEIVLLEALVAFVITSPGHPVNSIQQQKVVSATWAGPALFRGCWVRESSSWSSWKREGLGFLVHY